RSSRTDTVSSRSSESGGRRPTDSSAPRVASSSNPRAARGAGGSDGTPSTATPAPAARTASSPPEVTATTRQPRSQAWSKQDSVSAVPPENEDTTASESRPQYSGSWASFTTSHGTTNRRRYRARTTSPATPEPPMPHSTIGVTPDASGRPRTERPIR